MSAVAERLVSRSMEADDAVAVATLHAARLAFPREVLPLVRLAYEALLDSPLAVVRVLEDRGRVVGFVLATSDRQRLLSDLFSRRPGSLLRHFAGDPRGTMRALRILQGGVRRAGATAEILEVALEPDYRGRTLGARLVGEAVEALRQRGAEEVWAAAPAEHSGAWSALEANGFQRDPEATAVPGRTAAVRRGLVLEPGWRPGPFGLRDRLRCALRFEMLVLFPIYGLALIPFASLLAWLGCALDRKVGFGPLLPEPWNLAVTAVLLALGGFVLVWSYSYLILEGEGGPVPPFSAKTRRLVTTGPYSVVRHPSILAKLVGVIGLGFGFNSPSFLFGVVPLLLCWSILWNGSRQDGDLVAVFGEEYLEYRRRTGMILPRLGSRGR